MSSEIVISAQNLSKCYRIYDRPQDRFNEMIVPRLQKAIGIKPYHYGREFWALKDVSFEVKKGETFGIIGRNGSGKSTLLQLIAGILEPTSGNINVDGRIAALLELGSGFNPEFSGKENVFLNAGILGLTQEETQSRYQKIIEFADIGDFIDQPVKTYSSGMMVRLAFAVQASVDASIVIIDEALAVGDIFFRQKCYARLEVLKNSGAAILLVSHAMPEVEEFCQRAILLDHGKTQIIGTSSEAAKHYYLINQKKQNDEINTLPVLTDEEKNIQLKMAFDEPHDSAYIDLSGHKQISDGKAVCLRVAICDKFGEPCTKFKQGDLAVIFYEFKILKDIEAPICGLVIKNDRNIIVHGKNSWQTGAGISGVSSGMIVHCKQEVELSVGLGAYSIELGFASVPKVIWNSRGSVSHQEMASKTNRHCHLDSAVSFEVDFSVNNNITVLTHHGLADLSGNIYMAIQPNSTPTVINTTQIDRNIELMKNLPKVFQGTG